MTKTFTLLAAFFMLFSIQAQKSELALNLEKGKEYIQVSDSKLKIVQEVAGQKIDMDMTTKGTVSFFVKEITTTGYDIEAKFKNIGMTLKSNMSTFLNLGSEASDEFDFYPTIMDQMVNKPFTIKMTKGGKITQIDGLEEIWDDVINNSDEISDVERELFKSQTEQAFGGEAMRGNMEMVTAIFPDKKVAVGDQWTVISSLNSAMPTTVSTVYTLVERNKDHIVVQGDAKLNSLDKDEYVETNGMQMKHDISGTMKSEIKLDGKTGWIIESKTTQEMKGDIHVGGSPELPGGMSMTMNTKSETVITDHEIQ